MKIKFKKRKLTLNIELTKNNIITPRKNFIRLYFENHKKQGKPTAVFNNSWISKKKKKKKKKKKRIAWTVIGVDSLSFLRRQSSEGLQVSILAAGE